MQPTDHKAARQAVKRAAKQGQRYARQLKESKQRRGM